MSRVLPPELLAHILDHLAGPLHVPTDMRRYRKRQGALTRCCLVSRVFRDLAQARLAALVQCARDEDVDAFKNALEQPHGKLLAERVRVFSALGDPMHEGLPVDGFLPRLPKLDLVRIQGVESEVFDEFFHDTSQVPHLILDCVRIESPAFSFPLRLVSLSLYNVGIASGSLSSLLSSAFTPSLRALFMADLVDAENDDEPFLPTLDSASVSRLDMIQLDMAGDDDLCTPLVNLAREVGTPVMLGTALMYHWAARGLAAEHVEHIQLQHTPYNFEDGFRSGVAGPIHAGARPMPLLSCFVEAVKSWPNLRTLHLLPFLRTPILPAESLLLRKSLMKLCREKGVEVFWLPEKEGDEYDLNREFWTWARRRKEEGKGQ
ncbi:hypothetical protein JCM6882_005045 [Rhodosporidiobolus microsporus]